MGLPSSAGLPVPEAHRSFPGASGSALIPGPAVLARGTRSFCKPLHSGTEFVGTARSVPRLSPAAGSALRCPVIHPAGERSAGTAAVPALPATLCFRLFSLVITSFAGRVPQGSGDSKTKSVQRLDVKWGQENLRSYKGTGAVFPAIPAVNFAAYRAATPGIPEVLWRIPANGILLISGIRLS